MGCSASRSEETAVVVRCRERKELIRAAANHRFDLAGAHVSYFRSLKDVGDALRKFVDQEIAFGNNNNNNSSSSSTSLHSLDGEAHQKGLKHHHHHHHHQQEEEEDLTAHGGDHLHLDLSSSSDYQDEYQDDNVMRGIGEEQVFAHRDHYQDVHVMPFPPRDRDYYGPGPGPFSANTTQHPYPSGPFSADTTQYPYPSGPFSANTTQYPYPGYWGDYYAPPPASAYPHWGMPPPNININAYYMKKSSSQITTVIQQPDPTANAYTTSYFNYPHQNGGVFGVPQAEKHELPPPPPSPKAFDWDFFNPFHAVDSGFYPQTGYGYGSILSSPDSDEVREREGIPKLEEETEPEYQKSAKGSERTKTPSRDGSGPSSRFVPIQKSEASSRELPPQCDIRSSKSESSHKVDGGSMGMHSHMGSEGSTKDIFMPKTSQGTSSKEVPSHGSQGPGSSHYHNDSSISISSEEEDEITDSTEENNSSNPTIVKSMDDLNVNTKGVTFDLNDTSRPDFDSSKLSSLTAISVHGTRDLREVVAEIRDDFEVASSYGKEVALMLEVGKIPYQPSFIRVILSRIMFLVAPSASDLHVQSLQSVKSASKTVKLAKSFFADFGEDISMKHYNLSSTLDELYAWEKKLYKEVKEEERLRIIYEKQCKRLKLLDQQGAEPGKIDAAEDSVRKLLTKLSISIKAINAISNKIHKLRDNELQPQVSELIHGMTRMWKSMLKCHRKQFQAIMESKVRTLRANTALERESSVRATHELQRELVSWCSRFVDWINTQKSYVESLNGWLLRCLDYEHEDSADGPVPFSPGRLGAPPVFVMCHDWNQALEAISDSRVAEAMHAFASILRQMWEKQDEEHRQRIRAEETSKDYKQWVESLQTDKAKVKVDQHTRSDKIGVASESGISQLDDLKVDLDSLRKRLGEERAKHKDAIRMVHDAASTSIQGGLVPIFKALENFTCEALKAHEQVRLEMTKQTL